MHWTFAHAERRRRRGRDGELSQLWFNCSRCSGGSVLSAFWGTVWGHVSRPNMTQPVWGPLSTGGCLYALLQTPSAVNCSLHLLKDIRIAILSHKPQPRFINKTISGSLNQCKQSRPHCPTSGSCFSFSRGSHSPPVCVEPGRYAAQPVRPQAVAFQDQPLSPPPRLPT